MAARFFYVKEALFVSNSRNADINYLAIGPRKAAKMLDVSPNLLYSLIHSGDIRAVRAGKRWLIPMTAIESFLQQRQNTGG